MKKTDLNKKPIVVLDKSLDFFNDKILFPEKVEEANKMLKTVGLPDFKG